MQITDEVVSLAIDAARKHARDVMGVACEIEPETMRTALEAALGARGGHAPEIIKALRSPLAKTECDCFRCKAAACIEDLAVALKKTNARLYRLCECESESGCKDATLRDENSTTLERWGLK